MSSRIAIGIVLALGVAAASATAATKPPPAQKAPPACAAIAFRAVPSGMADGEQQAAEKLEAEGFEGEMRLAPDLTRWMCMVREQMVPEPSQ